MRIANGRLSYWCFFAALLAARSLCAYSVLTHEGIIDAAWDNSVKPVLLRKFPHATPAELIAAHGYAYGGAIIQDFGYYPRGSHQFSDLTHYIRVGEFIQNLISEAKTLNEYAFALGSLAHYAADEQGHSLAVNVAVPLLYPRLAQRYGSVVTYEENHSAHVQTEFSFDVVQVARGYYAPTAFHDFIGFGVAQPVLERAFLKTYCVPLGELFVDVPLAVNSYRHVVSTVIPRATKIAWVMKGDDIQKKLGGTRSAARQKFVYTMSRLSYEKEWGRQYERPGFADRLLAFLFRLLPKVGPLQALAFKTPTAEVETLFMKSFNAATDQYRDLLRQVETNSLTLRPLNLDTGKPPGVVPYRMADKAAVKWEEERRGAACPGR